MVPLPRGRDAAARATVDPVVKFVWKPARRAVGKPAVAEVWVDLISVVMVVSFVVVDAKANPFAATLPPTVGGYAIGWILVGVRVRKIKAPKSELTAGAADTRYCGGLINAMAVRWRTNFGSFG